jgi:hypothetical protein
VRSLSFAYAQRGALCLRRAVALPACGPAGLPPSPAATTAAAARPSAPAAGPSGLGAHWARASSGSLGCVPVPVAAARGRVGGPAWPSGATAGPPLDCAPGRARRTARPVLAGSPAPRASGSPDPKECQSPESHGASPKACGLRDCVRTSGCDRRYVPSQHNSVSCCARLCSSRDGCECAAFAGFNVLTPESLVRQLNTSVGCQVADFSGDLSPDTVRGPCVASLCLLLGGSLLCSDSRVSKSFKRSPKQGACRS